VKKTYSLKLEGKNRDRLLDAAKHDIRNFAAVHRTAPSGRAVGSANLGSDPKNSGLCQYLSS